MKHFKFQIRGKRPDDGLSLDEHLALMAVLDRRLPGCKPSIGHEMVTPRDWRDEPIAQPGDMVLSKVAARFLTFQADNLELSDAPELANDCLREIGRPDLRAELREL